MSKTRDLWCRSGRWYFRKSYRARDGRLIKPYIRKCCPYEGLVEDIRDEFGSGQYAIFIRGKTIIFAGIIGVETPIGWQPPG